MIDICQWRACIGLWYCHLIPYTTKTTHSTHTTDIPGWIKSLLMSGDGGGTLIFSLILFLLLLLILSGDVELNPGPKTELTLSNALQLLVRSGFVIKNKWSELTSILGVSLEERKRLKTIASSDQDFHFVLEEGLQWWITNGTAPTWEEFISAVESCGDVDVATMLRRQLNIKNEGKIEGQKKGTNDHVKDQTFSLHGNSVHGDIEDSSAIESNEVCKVLKSVLTSHFADLSNQLSRCLPRVSVAMYSKRMINESVRKSPAIDSVIDEFESGLQLANNISMLQEHCQLFLQCLCSEGGPTKLAAQKLCKNWVEEVKKKCSISLHLTCDEQDIEQQGSHHINKIQLDLLKIANTSAGDKNEQTEIVAQQQGDKTSQFDFHSIDEQLQKITVTPDDPVAKKLRSLYNKFVKLVENTKQALNKLIENRTHTFTDIASYLGEYFRVKGLTDATGIPKLFEALWPHYSYLDVEVLEVIIENEDFLIEERLQRDMCNYKQFLEEFKHSTTLSKFKNAVEEALIPNPEVTSITCEVVIKLNRQWGKKTLENFKTLVNHMFHQRMTHIHVEEGSICITLLVPRSKLDYLLEISDLKKEFISLIGIFEMTVDGQYILKKEEETQFSFDQALQEASKFGDDEVVQFLLDLIDDLNYQNNEGRTALMLASEEGHEQVIQTLLLAEGNINIQDNNGYTALMIACDTNSYTIVNYLLQAGANPDLQNDAFDTAIIIACQNSHFGIVNLLLQFNADRLLTSRNDDTAITVATRQNSSEIVEMLLEQIAESQKSSAVTSALSTACQCGHSQIIISLLEKLFDTFTLEEFQLFILCAKGDNDSTECHIHDSNVNINCALANGVTPLMVTSSCGHAETVQVLLQVGAHVNNTDSNGYSPLVYAITGHKSFQVIEQLLKACAQPSVYINGQSIADKAREERREDICKLLQQFNVVKMEKSKEEVLEQLLKVCDSFTIVKTEILLSLQKLITERKILLVDVVEFLCHYFGNTKLKVENVDQLFNALQPHYYLLNMVLLRKMVDKFIGGKLQKHLQNFIDMVKTFEETTQLQTLGHAMKHVSLPKLVATPNISSTMTLKFHEQWQNKNVVHVRKLLNYSFSNASPFLNHILIEEEGSACVCKLVVLKSQLESLVVNAVEKRQFMYQVGVYEVYIGHQPILMEDYNQSFSFRRVLQNSIESEDFMLTSFLIDIDVSFHNDNSIHEAAIDGNVNAVELLINKHIDINVQDKNGETSLMLASSNGHAQVVELLLKNHADVNVQNENGVTALMIASENGHYQVVELLLKEHANINAQKEDGVTALMLASYNGHHQVIKVLLKENANINTQKKDGGTALMIACFQGHHQVVELLLKEHAEINTQKEDGVTALMLASFNGHHQVVERLLKEHANVNAQKEDGGTALMLASQNGHHHVIELLIKEHASINLQAKNGLTALMLASQGGHQQVIELLLKEHADINAQKEDGWTALMLASLNGHHQVIQLLLREHASINTQEEDGWTALMLACRYKHFKVAQSLLQSKADPHLTKHNGSTALSLAAFSGNRELVNMLLDKTVPSSDETEKAVIESCLGGHYTLAIFLSNKLLHLNDDQRELLDACIKGDLGTVIMKILGSPDTPLVLGLTPLMVASSYGHVDIVDALIQAGADVNKNCYRGLTPLFFAVVGSKSISIVETLLKNGASPNIIVDKEAPLDDANMLELEAISKLLTQYGGQTALQLQEIELKSSLLTSDKQKATAMPSQITAELNQITSYKDFNYTNYWKTKEKILQLRNVLSIFSSLTPYILNPTHTFKDTSVKRYIKNKPKDNKKEAKEIYTVMH